MENKVNLVELLRYAPSGMELDCALFENLEFDHIDKDNEVYAITCRVKSEKGFYNTHTFTEYGCYTTENYSKCVIFPKGKTTWEGFVPPCNFKDGDIVFYNDTIAIFKEWGDETLFRTYVAKYLYCDSFIDVKVPLFGKSVRKEIRLATEEEKEKLFKAIKDYGYTWNAETKTLEELADPKFKPGDVLVSEQGNIVLLSHIDSEDIVHYHCIIRTYNSFNIEETPRVGVGKYYDCVLANEQQRQKMYDKIKSSGYKYNQSTNKLEKVSEPKFKVGDRIRRKNGDGGVHTIDYIYDKVYGVRNYTLGIPICEQDEYELVHGKFGIPALKPFDKVLVRKGSFESWGIQFFDTYETEYKYPYVCLGDTHYGQCVPYTGNEYLLNKRIECDKYYNTWD